MSVYQKDNGKWYSIFQINGERKHLLCTGATNKKEAEQMENAFKYRLQQQQNGVIPREEKAISMNILCDTFLEYSEQNKKSYKQDKSRVKRIREFFKNAKSIKDVKPNDIEKFKAFLLSNNKSKTTVNRYLEILSKMFNIAVDNDWLDKNPIKHDTKFPVKNYKVRYLLPEEEGRLMAVLPQFLKDMSFVALNTGFRRANLLDLNWEQIDLNGRIIEILDNKSNKHIKKPINNDLLAFLQQTPPEKRTGYLFINPRTGKKCKEIKRAWTTAKMKAGIVNFRFHDLRHTVGTRLAEKGVPVPVIKEVLDHSDIKTTMRYVHTADEQILSAMNLLNSDRKDLIQND